MMAKLREGENPKNWSKGTSSCKLCMYLTLALYGFLSFFIMSSVSVHEIHKYIKFINTEKCNLFN